MTTRGRWRAVLAVTMLATALARTMALAAEDKPDFPPEQIEQMVAPIALYPDPLVTTILMASTYPLEVVQADRWLKANPKVTGAALDEALKKQSWDDSVKSLCRTPDVIDRMSKNLDWTSDLGDAFLDQQQAVLDAVQRMRKKAENAGNLKTTPQQTVIVEKEVIKIVPADPQVIYVPTYSAPVVYGSAWSYPSYYYPPMYTYPPGYTLAASALSFGVGMAVGAAVWGTALGRRRMLLGRWLGREQRRRHRRQPQLRRQHDQPTATTSTVGTAAAAIRAMAAQPRASPRRRLPEREREQPLPRRAELTAPRHEPSAGTRLRAKGSLGGSGQRGAGADRAGARQGGAGTRQGGASARQRRAAVAGGDAGCRRPSAGVVPWRQLERIQRGQPRQLRARREPARLLEPWELRRQWQRWRRQSQLRWWRLARRWRR